MSTPSDPIKSPVPESPTTVRPLDLDDDDIQDGPGDDGLKSPSPTNTPSAAAATIVQKPSPSPTAPKPASVSSPTTEENLNLSVNTARPMTETQKNENILKEAFPSVDAPVIKAVLTASSGNVDRAFHALLQMTDPDASKDDDEGETAATTAPPQPPRPSGLRKYMTQLESDELYARQLAEQYENAGAYEARTHGEGSHSQRGQNLNPNELYDRDHSFIDDDLPVIKENLRKGFLETQTKVNSWITTMKKKLDEALEDENDDSSVPPYNQQKPGTPGFNRRPVGGPARRSGDYERYDADPQVITDDFAGMKLSADGTPLRDGGKKSPSNPNLFRPPPPPLKSPVGRKVAFREEIDEIESYDTITQRNSKDGFTGAPPATTNAAPSSSSASAAKASKWQPLSPAVMTPVTDNDPFTLGDSDDERDTHSKKEIKMEDKEGGDSERLRKAAAEAMSDSLVTEPKKP
ncbi:hypothetical protein BROUX41_000211 [Berkeleyomyces rouxiae]|uniref:uncharacterized protein n=1 Tax=Berkeleyomyces rouxiae TaxID=2035830 RepID=UPI003B805A48